MDSESGFARPINHAFATFLYQSPRTKHHSKGPYLPTRRLTGEHGDSVICLAFSANARYLASGSDDATLVIWRVEDGIKLSSFRLDSPALSLVWDSHRENRLFIGCLDGTAGFIDKFKGEIVPLLTGLRYTPVYALAVDPFTQPCRIAIGAGPEVHIAIAINQTAHYATNSIFPRPSLLPRLHAEEEEADDRLRARSLHFTNCGRSLIVSYLNHGVVCWDVTTSAQLWCIEPNHTHRHIGFSAISLDEKEIAISNLSTGVDLYSLESMSKTRSFVDTILPDTNYPIAVEFLANGSLVSSGSHTGRVCLWDKHSCAIFQVLDHGLPPKLVRCIAVQRSGDAELVATATTGRDPYIQIWASLQPRENSILQLLFRVQDKCQVYWTIEDATTSLPLLRSLRDHGFYREALFHVLDLPHCRLQPNLFFDT